MASIHITELQLRSASPGTPLELTTTQHTELERAVRDFVQAAWARGWRGAGYLGHFTFGERTIGVTCMAFVHHGIDQNEGLFIATYS